MRRLRAFTLLEMLISISLLAILTVATLQWVMTLTRAQQATADQLTELGIMRAIADAMRDDIVYALPDNLGNRYAISDGQITMTTLNRMPGIKPGVHKIVWRQDQRRAAFVREVILSDQQQEPLVQTVSKHIQLIKIIQEGDAGILTIICRTLTSDRENHIPISYPGVL